MTCSTCNDTHWMEIGDSAVMCTHCPTPCNRCRYKNGAYCDDILGPCTCSCHASAAPNRADVALVAGLTAAWEAAQLTPCDPDDYSALDSDMIREIRGITDAAGFDGIPFLDDAVRCAINHAATALRTKNAELVHVLKQLREVIQPSVTALIGSYIVMTPDIDVEWAHGVRNRVEKVGREIDDALIAFADDVAVKERTELLRENASMTERITSIERHGSSWMDRYDDFREKASLKIDELVQESARLRGERDKATTNFEGAMNQIAKITKLSVEGRAKLYRDLAEARAAAEVQADAIGEQAADMERLRRRLSIEFEKTKAMNRALGEVWEQVPDEDRIGKPADQWVRGLGRLVRELQRVAARACGAGPVAEDERTI